MAKILSYQLKLSPALPVVTGNIDYQNFEQFLFRIDEMLRVGKIDDLVIRLCYEHWISELSESEKQEQSGADISRFNEASYKAFRSTLLKSFVGLGYRGMSIQLAQSPLHRWFCGIETLGQIHVPAKSSLHYRSVPSVISHTHDQPSSADVGMC